MDALAIRPDGTYVDLTFGGGGHSRGILQRLSAKGRLFGFDQDRDARANVPRDDRFRFVESNFRFMRGWLRALGVGKVDGILADLGVSSHHFDTQRRGFSFRFDAPLDMRMNQRAGFSAADVIGTYDRQRLTRILRDYGELDAPHRVAQCIVQARERAPLETIDALIEAVAPVTPRGGESKFLAKLFQAVRIEVNGEMDALEMMLEQSLRVLRPGGRACILEFGSGRERIWGGLYNVYLDHILPLVGRAISRDGAYGYLADSIRAFPTATELEEEMRAAGFARVWHKKLTSGIVCLHVGEKAA